LILGGAVATREANATVDLSCVSPPTRVGLPAKPETLRLAWVDAVPGWIELEETGQIVEITAGGASLDIASPLRYGTHWIAAAKDNVVDVRRGAASIAAGTVLIRYHCTPAQQPFISWLTEASAISKQLDAPKPAPELDRLFAQIAQVEQAAPDAKTRALALHLRAQAYLVNGRNADAATAFAAAEIGWLEADDKDRALVAHVAQVEDKGRTAEYEAVLGLVKNAPIPPGGSDTYFRVRLEDSRCLALSNLARFAESDACYKSAAARMDALGEYEGIADTLYDYAHLQMKRGELASATTLLDKAAAAVEKVESPYVHGHIEYLRTDLLRRRGDVSGAIMAARTALDDFSKAHMPRWQGNVLLDLAEIYASLDAADEAYAALAGAVENFSSRNAPTRLARAMLTFAALEHSRGQYNSAKYSAAAARSMFVAANMPVETEWAQRLETAADLHAGRLDDAARAIAVRQTSGKSSNTDWSLLEAELALRENRLPDARAALDEIARKPLALRDELNRALLDADYRSRSGDGANAQQTLWHEAQSVLSLASRSNNQVLRYALRRQIRVLQNRAFELALQTSRDQAESLQAAWLWLGHVESSIELSELRSQGSEQFDRAVGSELIAPASGRGAAESATTHELLSVLARTRGGADTAWNSQQLPLEMLQRSLDEETAFLAYVGGQSHGALMWVTRTDAKLLPAASPEELRTATIALREAVRTNTSSTAQIQIATQTVSDRLLRSAPTAAPPKRLLVLADEVMSRIPWPAVRWPGQVEPLLETTSVELVTLADSAAASSRTVPTLHAIVAAQRGGSAALAGLDTASAEPMLIQDALLASAHIALAIDTAPTRAAVLGALAEPGAWVHIAAHGAAQPQRIGYAGLWLEPQGDAMPAFLSWIDILEQGARADLVVLNACQLGDSGGAVDGNMSFAAAVSQAGAKQVVAAAWPVSDAAAALWVPAFYAALSVGPKPDAAEALRSAQLRLRHSRAFAHPYFWAGMQTLRRFAPSIP
jgi:CHAT domain-containing protein